MTYSADCPMCGQTVEVQTYEERAVSYYPNGDGHPGSGLVVEQVTGECECWIRGEDFRHKKTGQSLMEWIEERLLEQEPNRLVFT